MTPTRLYCRAREPPRARARVFGAAGRRRGAATHTPRPRARAARLASVDGCRRLRSGGRGGLGWRHDFYKAYHGPTRASPWCAFCHPAGRNSSTPCGTGPAPTFTTRVAPARIWRSSCCSPHVAMGARSLSASPVTPIAIPGRCWCAIGATASCTAGESGARIWCWCRQCRSSARWPVTSACKAESWVLSWSRPAAAEPSRSAT